MLGFSLIKLLFTGAVVAALWYGFRYLGRLAEIKADRAMARPETPPPRPAPSPTTIEDLKPCPQCGAYVANGLARACGRVDCPYK
ncbi:MAG: hypothetical protein HQL37_05350 [Alphaproteobacteria bacterium]|nr:hypothetical protein [Alphaproteobacteria bacterium]